MFCLTALFLEQPFHAQSLGFFFFTVPVAVLLDDLIEADVKSFVHMPAETWHLVNSELSRRYRLPFGDLRQIEPEFFPVRFLVEEISVQFDWKESRHKHSTCNCLFGHLRLKHTKLWITFKKPKSLKKTASEKLSCQRSNLQIIRATAYFHLLPNLEGRHDMSEAPCRIPSCLVVHKCRQKSCTG